MARRTGTPNVGVRYDRETDTFLLRCHGCRRKGRESFWPITRDYWEPGKGFGKCRACHNEQRAATNRRRYQADPAFRAAKREANRQYRREMARVIYAQRWAELRADPIRYAEYLARRREQQRLASARYRARQREVAA